MVLFAVALCGHWAAGSASPPCACSLVFGQWQTCPAWTGFSLLCWPLKQTLHKHGNACFPACMLHCELPVWLSQSLVACKDQNTGMEDDLGVLQAASPSYLHFFFPWVTWFIKVLSPVILPFPTRAQNRNLYAIHLLGGLPRWSSVSCGSTDTTSAQILLTSYHRVEPKNPKVLTELSAPMCLIAASGARYCKDWRWPNKSVLSLQQLFSQAPLVS